MEVDSDNYSGQGDIDNNPYFNFRPEDFELFPKVNPELRNTYCLNTLWNLDDYEPDFAISESAQKFSLGQVWIRKYGLNIVYS